MKMRTSEGRRDKALRLLTTTAAVMTIPAGLLAIVVLLQMARGLFRSDLEAIAEYSHFVLPPQLARIIEDQASIISFEAFDSLRTEADSLAPTTIEQMLQADAVNNFGKRIQDHLRYSVLTRVPYEMFDLEGCWYILVSNSSKRKLDGVELSVPWGRFVQVARPGEQVADTRIDNIVSLGSMAPKEQMSVIVWTAMKPDRYYAEQLTLTHDSGIGDVRVLHPVGRMGQFADRYLTDPFLLLFFGFWLFIAWVSLLSLSQQQHDSQKKGSVEDQDESEIK